MDPQVREVVGELRNHLQVIITGTRLLRHTDDPAVRDDVLEALEANAWQAARLMRSLVACLTRRD